MAKLKPPHPRVSASRSPEEFLILDENRFACTALDRLHRREPLPFAPLVYVHGPSGIGKSILARRFAEDECGCNPAIRFKLLTAMEFSMQVIAAFRSATIGKFRNECSSFDVFVIEDAALLENRIESQRQLSFILDDLFRRQARCLITARKTPGELNGFLPQLVSRFRGGTVAAISEPEFPSRLRLIQHFADLLKVPVPEPAAIHLAEKLHVTPRELFAAVRQLDTIARMNRKGIDISIVEHYLNRDVEQPTISLTAISRAVAREFGLSVSSLRSGRRLQGIVLPRQCAMLLARRLTEHSLNRIARFFGRSNHSTVVHACHRVEERLRNDLRLQQQLTKVSQSLGIESPIIRA